MLFEIKTVDEIDQMIDLWNYIIYNYFKDWQRYTEVNILIRGRIDLLTLTSALWNKTNGFMFQQFNSVCGGVGCVHSCVCWKRIWLAAWFYNITCTLFLWIICYILWTCVLRVLMLSLSVILEMFIQCNIIFFSFYS